MTLKFERDIVRPALLAFEKAVVEGGHGSWGIYTKIPFTAVCAVIAGDARRAPSVVLSVIFAFRAATKCHQVFLAPVSRI
ncbi:MAG TPA: hypothetical protein VGZ91_12190 [Candidatus Sulfotelmatobacter sp.]|nr:hypothetical protein [Candidatus Sulfotelmatobacter sp.]